MRKLFIAIIIVLIPAIVYDAMSFFDVEIISEQPNIELMREVSSFEEAMELTDIFPLSLIFYSDYGFATFEASHDIDIDDMLTYDFVYHHHAQAAFVDMNPRFTNDPYFNQQYAIGMMNVDQVWNMTKGSSQIVIAVIDSGIDTSHEEFTHNISPLSYNSRTKEVGVSHIEDDTGHGTMVAGVIGARHDNGKGIKGVMAEVTLLVIKANNVDNPSTPDENEAEFYADSNVIEAIYYAVDQGAHVINLSLGGTYANPFTKQAIEYAANEGVVVVAASGNEGDETLMYPASFEHVISVGSVNQSEVVSDFSNHNVHVDITAPGESVVTTGLDNQYYYASGTSFAAPQVAAVIGLLLSINVDQTPAEIYHRITSTALDKGDIGKDIYYGFGIIDAYAAMTFAYFLVSFETFDGNVIDSMMVESDQTFDVDEPTKKGHTFEGWFLDTQFEHEFMMGIDTVNSDITLYAKFTPNLYQVTLIGFNHEEIILSVFYGEALEYSPGDIEGYQFVGWYFDQDFDLLYEDDSITTDLTLYARYDILIYTISYIIEDNLVFTDHVEHGSAPILYEPHPSEFTLLGWYIDDLFLFAYTPEPLFDHLILYGEIDYSSLNVIFYDHDMTTELASYIVSYGSPITPPNPPVKPNSSALSFEFTGWSESTSFITSHTKVYPEYDMTYHADAIFILAGLDTVFVGHDWIDAGIQMEDSLINIVVEGEINSDEVGRYLRIYKLYYQEVLLDFFVRSVHVIEAQPEIEIVINPTITTLFVGDTYHENGATSSIGEVEIIGYVDSQTPGVYELIYKVQLQDNVIMKRLFVYVLEKPVQDVDPLYVSKKEEAFI